MLVAGGENGENAGPFGCPLALWAIIVMSLSSVVRQASMKCSKSFAYHLLYYTRPCCNGQQRCFDQDTLADRLFDQDTLAGRSFDHFSTKQADALTKKL